MSLQFVYGPAGCGKSTYVQNLIVEKSGKEPRRSFILTVPDQFTIETQADIVKAHPEKGILNIDVLSFERLCYRVFSEAGEPAEPILDDTGKSLVLRRVASSVAKDMPYIGRNLNKTGYIHEVKSQISEFMQYGISVKDVENLAKNTAGNALLSTKLSDLAKIYRAFSEFNEGRFITGEEKLDILCKKMPKAAFLKGAFVVFDGFTGFTPIQERVILKLLSIGCEVLITLTVSAPEALNETGMPEKLFYLSRKTAARLKAFAKDLKVEVKSDIEVTGAGTGRFSGNPELLHLERNLFRYPYKTYDKEPVNIGIYACETPEAEIESTVLKISELVRERGFEYRDIAVIVGNLDTYASGFATRMKEVDIPFFIDKTSGIVLNPFIEYLKSALLIFINVFSYNSVFHYLKSGFTDFTRDETDRFDKYVRSLNIRGKAYSKEFTRLQKGMADKELAADRLPEIEALRAKLMSELSVLARPADTAGDFVKNLYEFITNNDSCGKLLKYAEGFERDGNLLKASEFRQIYKLVCKLLETIHDLIGEETMDITEFYRIFEAGINEIKVGSIPGNIDRVVVGDIERTRLNKVKALFFVGVNDGNIPKSGDKGGFLSNTEKDLLLSRGIELAPTPREEMYTQRLYLYMNLLKPSDCIYLSYSGTDTAGKSMYASYLIDVLLKIFPKLSAETVSDRIETGRFINAGDSLRYFAGLVREYAKNSLTEAEKSIARALLKIYEGREEKLSKDITEAAFSEYMAVPLSKEITELLYSSVLKASVSRMEMYAGCAYSFFLQYGMQLKENDDFDFKSSDLGNIYHGVLDTFSGILEKEGTSWADFDPKEGKSLVERAVREYCENYEQGMLKEDERSAYTVSKITKMMQRTIETLQFQLKRGKFLVSEHEKPFERKLDFEGGSLLLRGKIDRIDLYEEGGRLYVKVVDYKSGKHDLDVTDIYYGLNEQLVVYMAEALKREKELHPGKEVLPSAMLYYTIDNPMVNVADLNKSETPDEKILKDLRPNGIIENSAENCDNLDTGFEGTSLAIPVSKTNSGAIAKTSLRNLASSEEIAHMTGFVENLIKKMAAEIKNGNITASPYVRGDRSACDFCSFHGICRFDDKFPGFKSRDASGEDPEEIRKKIMGGEDAV